MQQNNDLSQDEDLQDLSTDQIQRILAVGEQASQLLGSGVYQVAYRKVLDQNYSEWLTSSPKEREKRESLYQATQGLIAVTEELAKAVEDARRLLQEQEQRNSPAARNQEYLDTQGFGT
jgi:hypothetical protein